MYSCPTYCSFVTGSDIEFCPGIERLASSTHASAAHCFHHLGVARSTKCCGSPRWVCIPTHFSLRWRRIRRMTNPSSWKVGSSGWGGAAICVGQVIQIWQTWRLKGPFAGSLFLLTVLHSRPLGFVRNDDPLSPQTINKPARRRSIVKSQRPQQTTSWLVAGISPKVALNLVPDWSYYADHCKFDMV